MIKNQLKAVLGRVTKPRIGKEIASMTEEKLKEQKLKKQIKALSKRVRR